MTEEADCRDGEQATRTTGGSRRAQPLGSGRRGLMRDKFRVYLSVETVSAYVAELERRWPRSAGFAGHRGVSPRPR